MERSKPKHRTEYPVFYPLQTRWNDNDPYGHMNNAMHYQLFDTAVNGWLIQNGLLDIHNGSNIYLVVETGCKYFSSLSFPNPIDAGIRITKLGNSSVHYEVSLFESEENKAAATGFFVHINVDKETRRPKAISTEHRHQFKALQQ